MTVNAGSTSVRLDLLERRADTFISLTSVHQGQAAGRERELIRSMLAGAGAPQFVVHRIVHGGSGLRSTHRLSKTVLAGILKAAPLAPLHIPAALRWIAACTSLLSVPQWAAPDCAFFRDLPAVAATYAIPRRLARQHGLQRLGFHGFAHRSLLRRWEAMNPGRSLPRRIVTLQLGAGCSAAAIADGKPIDTSMGFTPTEGLVMATRCGDLDAGAALHLQQVEHWSAQKTRQCLTEESGLMGLAGSADMQVLLKRRTKVDLLAIDQFCYRIRKYVGAYAAVLGGLDAVLISGGIGEHAPEIRARALEGLAWLGLNLDTAVNMLQLGVDGRISARTAGVEVWVLKANEAEELARAALDAGTRRKRT